MKRSLGAAALLLFFLLGIGTVVFAGDNENAIVTLEVDKVANVGPSETLTVSVVAEGFVNAVNILIGLQFDPAALSPGTVEVNTDVLPAGFPGWAVFSEMEGADVLLIAGAALGDVPVSLPEANWVVNVPFTTAADFSVDQQTTIALSRAEIGNQDETTDVLSVEGVEVTLNAGPPPPALVSIGVEPATAEVGEGEEVTFTATGTYDDESTADVTAEATWTVDPPAAGTLVGSVFTAGMVTEQVVATVTAAIGDVSGTASVTVSPPPPPVELASIAVSPATVELKVGKTQPFTAEGTGTDGNPFDIEGLVSWAVSDAAVGTITAAGLFTAAGAGTAEITAEVNGVVGTAAVTVVQPTLATITVTPGSVAMVVGQSRTFSASGKDTDGEDMAITPVWSVSDATVGTVNAATGEFTAVGPGAAEVRATVGDVVGTASVTVELPQPASVDLIQGDQIVLTSPEGKGSTADSPASRGEAKYEFMVWDQSGAGIGGATVTWTVENMGDENAWIVKAEHAPVSIEIPVSVPAGASVELTTTANPNGHVYITLDSENTTSVKITGSADGLSDAAMLSWQMAVPVELASFTGTLSKEGVVLRWVTASQTNNYGWYIYRSMDRGEFAQIGFVKGAGTTVDVKSYTFTDADLPSAKVVAYYLRQINTDGTAGDSPMISVDLPSTAVRGEHWGALKARFAR